MSETKSEKIEKLIPHLNETELVAFRYWQDSNTPELPIDTSVRFYSLFLNGNSCEEIVALNPNFTLGQVVHARLSLEWDRRKERYMEELLQKTEQRHRQVSMETINFISNLLAANAARYNNKLRKYWASQKEEDLGDMALSLKQIKEMAELHQKLAGTDGSKRQVVSGEVTHVHKVESELPLDAEEAGDLIHEMLESRKS